MLRAVPIHLKITDHPRKNVETDVYSHVEDPRWIFLNAPENRDKYYYVRRGDNLEPLGRFIRVNIINNYYSNLRDNYIHYNIEFEIPPSTIINENDQLYYTDEPPAAGSVPLTINDIPTSGGKKTKKYRKKNKKYKTIRNKKRRFRVFKKK
jgi:hypothetical protein